MTLRSLLNNFLDIIIPPRCIICKKQGREQICSDCFAKIRYVTPPYCKICGKPHDSRFEGGFCHECYRKKTPFDLARSATEYEGTIKEALHMFKFSNRHSLKIPLGKIMADYLAANNGIDLSQIDIIMPVPLSRKKERSREYNQAKLLAEELSKHTGLAIDDESLKRVKETTPQFELSREERLKNLKDAFMASDEVKDKAVLLIDDIYTTGSTVKESSLALKRSGAKRVCVLTLARAVQ